MEQHERRAEGEQREASCEREVEDNVSDGEEQEADMEHHEHEMRGYGQWDPATAERTVDEAERARGAFLGLAWGDVFGCPIEGWRANSIARIYGDYTSLPSAHPVEEICAVGKGYARKLRPIGLYSDDTQQCMVLINLCLVNPEEPEESSADESSDGESEQQEPAAESPDSSKFEEEVTEKPIFTKPLAKGMGRVPRGDGPPVRVQWNARKWGRTLGVMFRRDALRDYGRNFKEAVAKLNHNIRPQQSGSKSEGMGAAMRIGALGALFRYDPDALAACAWESSLTTHATLPAAAMSFAVAYAVGCLVRGDSVEEVRAKLPNAVSEREKHWLLNHGDWEIWASTDNCHLISSCLRDVFSDLDLRDRKGIREFISQNAKPNLAEGFNKAHPNQGHVLLGGVHGLIMALLPDIHPQEILREIVVLGYDTDTVAAICGSVLGARFGVGWIPTDRLLELPRLQAYAEALVLAGRAEDKRRPHELETLEELIEKEVKLTAWGKSVKRQNAMTKAAHRPQRGVPVEKDANSDDDDDNESGRKNRGTKGKGNKRGPARGQGKKGRKGNLGDFW